VTYVLEESPGLYVCSPNLYAGVAVNAAAYFGLGIAPDDRERPACRIGWPVPTPNPRVP